MSEKTYPECPHCGLTLGGEVPIAIRERDVGEPYMATVELVDGELVLPAYTICPECDERVYFAGAEQIAEELGESDE